MAATPTEFLTSLDEFKPLACIFNSISWSVNPKRSKDNNGYVKCASVQQAEKIGAITECWECLITGKKTPIATAMSLTLHRVTGSREATTLYHHTGMGRSHTDVRFLTNTWPNFGDYKIPKKKRKSPKSFPEFTDKYLNSSLLDDPLSRDIAWVLVAYLGKTVLQKIDQPASIDDLQDTGSWTAFMKDTASAETFKCKLEYFPVVPFPPSGYDSSTS